ncbi:ABC transporter substrate-binding protein [Microbaculum marinum]|uniref:ABC transporter substrate-binding protein n=1 Tax=Microbaculum marinum TaxID=1764581 RepID=A0AAW9RQX6_9HYPH
MLHILKKLTPALALAALVASQGPAGAQAPGVSDTEIKIGQTMAYSGPASSYGVIGKAEAAYFDMVNDNGGINGRKINLISLDDGYSPPKTVELTRQLVEQDGVAFIFQSLGTPPSTAVQKYLNQKGVPQLFIASGAGKWNNPEEFPWSTGWQPTYPTESAVFGKHILQTNPDAKVAVLYQNDDLGRDYRKGLVDAFGDRFEDIVVGEATFEASDPTVDSQIVSLQASGADTLVLAGLPRPVAQAIRKAYDIGWKPTLYLPSGSSSVSSVLTPAGLDKSVGAVTVGFLKDPTDAQWADDEEYKAYAEWMDKYYPDGDKAEFLNAFGYAAAATLVKVLEMAGDDLSRENIMKQVESLDDVAVPMLLPGVTVSVSPENHSPIRKMRTMRFNGEKWEIFGDLIEG